MKQIMVCLALLAVGLQLRAGPGTRHAPSPDASGDKPALPPAQSVVWAGIDYSRVRIVQPTDAGDPKAILPEMAFQWNHLFLRECVKGLAQSLDKTVELDTDGVDARNRLTTFDQIILSPKPEDTIKNSHISQADIAGIVRSCQLAHTNGLGLLFVVDRLVKPAGEGAVYVVFFDVESRDIVSVERQVHMANGVGFRNYWFGVIKRTVGELSGYRHATSRTEKRASPRLAVLGTRAG